MMEEIQRVNGWVQSFFQVKQIPEYFLRMPVCGDEPLSDVIVYVDDGGIKGTPESIK
jgi:hypothetical protein